MIPDDILNKIDNETDLVTLVGEFVSLERVGKNFRGLCPFHDDNSPSFYVTPEKNIAKCMSCGEGGRPINFLRKIKNISFNEAVEDLASRLGIELPKTQTQKNPHNHLYEIMDSATKFYEMNLFNSKTGLLVLDYLSKRKLAESTIKEFRLGYAQDDNDNLYQYLKELGYKVSDMMSLGLVKQNESGDYYDFFRNRLIFPITNEYNKVIAFSGRTLSKNERNKYVNSPETPIFIKSRTLYNLANAGLEIRKLKKAYIFEGFFDVISAYQEGVLNVVATMGTALTNDHINLIKKSTDNIIMAFDGDEAGINAVLKQLPLLDNKLKVEVVLIPDKLDPDDYFKNYGAVGFLKLVENEALDSFAFRYNYFLSKTDFKNANDIKAFQDNVTKMLSSAPEAVISLYKGLLSERLNISVDDIKVTKKTIREPQPQLLPPKQVDEKAILDSRYVVAEQRLFILMLRDNDLCDRINNSLNISEYAHPVLSKLRTKIQTYYHYNESFIINEFKDLLEADELSYFETKIQKDMYWIDQPDFEESEINKYLKLLKTTPKLRREKYLRNVMIEKKQKGLSVLKEQAELSLLQKELKGGL